MSEAAGEAFVLQPGEGRPIDLGGFRMFVKATRDETGGSFSLLEADEPAGFGPPLHIHHDAAEAFYVLEGEYIVFLDSREVSCPAGSFIFIPAGTSHGFRVGGTASRKLNFYTPAAMVGYFDDLSDVTRKGRVDPEVLSEIAVRYSNGGAGTGTRGLRVNPVRDVYHAEHADRPKRRERHRTTFDALTAKRPSHPASTKPAPDHPDIDISRAGPPTSKTLNERSGS